MTETPEKLGEWVEQAGKLGTEAGEGAAEWWEQDAIGGRASGDPAATARIILDGLASGDPAIMEALPRPDLSGEMADAPTPRWLFETVTGADAHAEATWNQDAYQATLEDLCTAWEDGAADAVQRAVERQCRAALGLNEMEEARRRRYLETERS